MRASWPAAIFALLMLGTVLSPALGHPDDDSFPLSHYPMFSHHRPRDMTIAQALGVRDDGTTQPLGPMLSAGNREVLQSMMTLEHAIQTGRAPGLCREIAERVAASAEHAEIVHVRIARSTFDVVTYFEGATEPSARQMFAGCRVAR